LAEEDEEKMGRKKWKGRRTGEEREEVGPVSAGEVGEVSGPNGPHI